MRKMVLGVTGMDEYYGDGLRPIILDFNDPKVVKYIKWSK
jgi:hypothetical protein